MAKKKVEEEVKYNIVVSGAAEVGHCCEKIEEISQKIEVTEEEIQDSINYLQRTRAKFIAHNNPAALKDFVEIKYHSKDIENNKRRVPGSRLSLRLSAREAAAIPAHSKRHAG